MNERPLTNAEKIAHARERMKALHIEPITTRQWKPAVAHIAPQTQEKPLPQIVTKLRRTA